MLNYYRVGIHSRIQILNIALVTLNWRHLRLLSTEVIINKSTRCLIGAHHVAIHHIAVLRRVFTSVGSLRSIGWHRLGH
jgi:hypothetical protein